MADTPDHEHAPDLYRLLIVDADGLFREMVESALALHNPSCTVVAASSPARAQALLEEGVLDVVVTDIDFGPAMDLTAGLLFLEQVALRQGPGEVLVVSARPYSDCRGLVDQSHFMPKPPVMDELLRRIDSILDAHRDSILRGLSLQSILQVIQTDNKTCTITVSGSGKLGFLYCQQGKLVHAVAGKANVKDTGREAALEILSWDDTTIRLTERCRAPQTITDPLTNILLDWALQSDQAERLSAEA